MNAASGITPLVEAFGGYDAMPGQPASLAALREAALRRFAELGFPRRDQEAWRFTNLRPLTASPFLPAPRRLPGLEAATLADVRFAGPAHRIVLVNGCFAPDLSDIGDLPEGAWIGTMAEAAVVRPDAIEGAVAEGDTLGAQPLASLNAAYFTDGLVLLLDPGTELELPVEIIHFADGSGGGEGSSRHLRHRVVLGAGGSATLIEAAAGAGTGWTNAVTEIALGEGATLRHAKVQKESPEAVHTALTRATLAARAKYESFNLISGARLSRQDVQAVLAGEGATLTVNGAYLLRDEQEATFAPFVDHAAFGCETNEVLKGVMQDRSHGVFLGTIVVRPGADQTNARQLNRNLLMSRTASVDTKPELEIHADDVKCSHGATIGSLDEMSLFYLQARGIAEAMARQMLVEAFAADTIDATDLAPPLRAHLLEQMQHWLRGPGSMA